MQLSYVLPDPSTYRDWNEFDGDLAWVRQAAHRPAHAGFLGRFSEIGYNGYCSLIRVPWICQCRVQAAPA